ncbi:DUF5689 domain-containing protein [Prevotella pallens]
MRYIKFIMIVAICSLFASCMGDSYAETDENMPSPYGNNELKETNLISIANLKAKFATPINTDYRDGKSYEQITEDLQIKGIVTSSDVAGNIYNELAIQDKTGAIIISIGQRGIYGFLPIGTEILIDLKDLYIGNYGKQAQIGVPTKNAKGVMSIGRISRIVWDTHYKILSSNNSVEVKEFTNGSAPTNWTFDNDAGRLGIIRNVSFKSSTPSVNGTFANSSGGAGSVSWTLNEQDGNKVIVYNSNFAKFANAKVPTGKVNITGIFKRFNNQWEIIIRSLDDIQPVAPAEKTIYSNSFAEAPTDWKLEQGTLPTGITFVWKWISPTYGMKASAFVNGQRYETHARAISPLIDLTKVTHATLSFDHAARYFDNFDNELKVQISTDGNIWKDLTIDKKPTGENWNFVTAKADLTPYCGKKVFISFFYNSTTTTAATWEFKNLVIK